MSLTARLRLSCVTLASAVAFIAGCGARVVPVKAPVPIDLHFAARRLRLPNGLDVVLSYDASFRDVALNMRYDVGAKDDPPNESGLAHLVYHLTQRSEVIEGAPVFAAYDSAGGRRLGGGVTPDWTEFRAIVPASQLELALWIESERMARPLAELGETTLTAERAAALNELREREDDVTYGRLRRTTLATLFPDDHPYHRAALGTESDLARVTVEDAARFASTHYAPSNATLVVAGHFDPTSVEALVVRSFGGIPAGKPPPARPLQVPQLTKDERRVLHAGVDAPALEVAWVLPPRGDTDWPELGLVADVLPRWLRSELQRDLRHVSVQLDSGRLASALVVRMELAAGASPGAALSKLDSAVDYIQLWFGSLDGTRRSSIARRTASVRDLLLRTSALQDGVSFYDDPTGYERELQAFSIVTYDSIRKSTVAWLKRPRAIVVVEPQASAPKAGRPTQ